MKEGGSGREKMKKGRRKGGGMEWGERGREREGEGWRERTAGKMEKGE